MVTRCEYPLHFKLTTLAVCKIKAIMNLSEKDKKTCNDIFTCLSSIAFALNVASDWAVYAFEGDPPVSNSLAKWWLGLCIFGTAISIILLLIDCCCCFDVCDVADQDERTRTSQFVVIATICEDLPLLIMSLITLFKIKDTPCAGNDGTYNNVLHTFILSGLVTCVISVFRFLKVCVQGCPYYNERKERDTDLDCLAYILYIVYAVAILLSIGVVVLSLLILC